MSTVTIRDFDPANYLDNDEVIVEYLKATAEDPNPEVFLAVLGDVARAKGMAASGSPSTLRNGESCPQSNWRGNNFQTCFLKQNQIPGIELYTQSLAIGPTLGYARAITFLQNILRKLVFC
jgi:hypothetical protein